jgi:uncharacterized membrane protein YkgB
MYHHPAPEYRPHMNKEGEVKPANQEWQQSNNTYLVSNGLGIVIVTLGLLIALYPVLPQASALGSGLLVLMSLTTLSFLVTTPEAWVPALGDVHHGFPYLSGVGRLIVKDFIMLGAAVLTMADSAKSYLHRSVRGCSPSLLLPQSAVLDNHMTHRSFVSKGAGVLAYAAAASAAQPHDSLTANDVLHATSACARS